MNKDQQEQGASTPLALRDAQPCNEVLYADGQPMAVCQQEHGTEHSHCDATPYEAVNLGLARHLLPSDTIERDDVYDVAHVLPATAQEGR